MTPLDPALCVRLIADAREDEPRPLMMRVIEISVNAALGEVARQQGGIAMPTGREAHGIGIADGRTAMRAALRLVLHPLSDQLEAALAEVARLQIEVTARGEPKSLDCR